MLQKMRQLDDFQHAAGCREGSQQVQLRAALQEATHAARNAGQALEVMGQEEPRHHGESCLHLQCSVDQILHPHAAAIPLAPNMLGKAPSSVHQWPGCRTPCPHTQGLAVSRMSNSHPTHSFSGSITPMVRKGQGLTYLCTSQKQQHG